MIPRISDTHKQLTEESNLDLIAIENRERAATPGQWEICLGSGSNLCTAIKAVDNDKQEPKFTPICDLLPDWILLNEEKGESLRKDHRADMDFISHARQDIPDLIAEVKRLQIELEQLRLFIGKILYHYTSS